MSSPSSETVLIFVLLQYSVFAFPTGSDQDSTTSIINQCQHDSSAPECRNTSLTSEALQPTSAPSAPSSTTSETWSQVPTTPSESNTASATALSDSWGSPKDDASADWSAEPHFSEPHSLLEIAQRSLSGRVLLFLYSVISRSDILQQIESVARRRKNDYWPMLIGMFTVGGTLLTAGMAALAAMSGKALMSSMLALGMSLIAALRAPPRRCRRSAITGRSDCSSNYELIARPVVTHSHAHSAALQLEQPYPGYVRSFLDFPLDSNGSPSAAVPAGSPTIDPAATWINYRVPDNAADNTAFTANVVGMRSPSRTMNMTTSSATWGPGPPPSTVDGPNSNFAGFSNQPRELTYSGGYSNIKTEHAE